MTETTHLSLPFTKKRQDLSAIKLDRENPDVGACPVDGLEDRQLEAFDVETEVVDRAAVEGRQDCVQWKARHSHYTFSLPEKFSSNRHIFIIIDVDD